MLKANQEIDNERSTDCMGLRLFN